MLRIHSCPTRMFRRLLRAARRHRRLEEPQTPATAEPETPPATPEPAGCPTAGGPAPPLYRTMGCQRKRQSDTRWCQKDVGLTAQQQGPKPDASFPCAGGQTGSEPCFAQFTSWQADRATAEHNKFRAKHSSPPLTYDEGIADYIKNSKGFKETCETKGLVHNDDRKYGENLWGGNGWKAGDTWTQDGATSAQAWYCGEEPCADYNDLQFADGIGHMTAVVWKGTTKFGCAVCVNGKFTAVGCSYDPPGNWFAKAKENVLEYTDECATPEPATPAPDTERHSSNSRARDERSGHDCA
eukprot:TRINITY_DN4737_c0_g1_i3.p1 TRINITY_DN4737_c0_g1~~TRINITY_DN4737_c0_g1_i3.p1  ORF type:complete len:297 (+),score=77.68 TRINITY_DN4737_c0_g1_i3:278-1168(+)